MLPREARAGHEPGLEYGRLAIAMVADRPRPPVGPVIRTVPELISLTVAHHATGPWADTNVPVGPSGPICAIRTMIAAPSSTVWVPVRPLRSVLV
jgi:hypothetical protein